MTRRFENAQEVYDAYIKGGEQLVIFEGDVFNVKEFMPTHPGGSHYIEEKLGKDITEAYYDAEHSSSAKTTLMELKIGYIAKTQLKLNPEKELADNVSVSTSSTPKSNKAKFTREDIAKKIDLKKGLCYQVWSKLTKDEYVSFVEDPKHLIEPKDAILFDSWYLEMFTKTPWYAIPLFWGPVILFMIYKGLQYTTWYINVIALILGVITWTLTEYGIHKYIFHSEDSLPDNGNYLLAHFLLHGIHHAFPMDRYRLVFPILPGTIVAGFILTVAFAILPIWVVYGFFGGFLIGYACYDTFHYWIHHSNPKEGYVAEMKVYHMKHHYKEPLKGYGISNKIWDHAFGTLLV